MLDEARLRERPLVAEPAQLLQRVAAPLAEVEREIDSILDAGDAFLYEASAHLHRSGGKRLRPALHLLSVEACGVDPSEPVYIRLAAALECIHMATLVHDDVIDGSDQRRGVPTVHHKWGAHTGVLVGDYLFARAFTILSDIHDNRVLRLMADVVYDMASGEIAEQRRTFDFDQTPEDYFRRVHQKTASFMAECCRLAAVVLEEDAASQEALRRYGQAVGMGFQIVDDLLDFTADRLAVGKPVGSDLRSGVLTLPALYTLGLPKLGPRFRRILEETAWGNAEMDGVMQCLQEADAIRYCYDLARKHADDGRRALLVLPDGPARDVLDQLALALVERGS